MANKVQRVIDNVVREKIIAVVEGKGRFIVLEGDDYPSGGLVGMSKKSFAAALAAALKK